LQNLYILYCKFHHLPLNFCSQLILRSLINLFLQRTSLIMIIVFLLTLLNVSCQKSDPTIINEDKFIEIYARLNIINHLSANKEFYDKLVSELLTLNKVSLDEVNAAVEYYKLQPERWVTILEKVRERIKKLKLERIKQVPQVREKTEEPVKARPRKKPSAGKRRKKKIIDERKIR